jgi:hypothetical protein
MLVMTEKPTHLARFRVTPPAYNWSCTRSSPEETATTDRSPNASHPNRLPAQLVAGVPALAAVLANIDEGSFLWLTRRGTGRYVQFIAYESGLRGETVGNAYLERGDQLGVDDLAWLAHHGWSEPDECGNYWRHWEPANPLAAATAGFVTLHLIHGLERLRDLEIGANDDCAVRALTRMQSPCTRPVTGRHKPGASWPTGC